MAIRNTEQRREQIVALIRQRGYVSNEELARLFSVAVQTVRRDVNYLAANELLSRHHGGTSAPSSIENIEYSERQVLNLPEKQRIAAMAAAQIPNRCSLFINIGTTTEEFARALINHQDLRVITNNMNVASLLSRATNFHIVVVGGTLRNRDGGLLGLASCEMIERFRVDFGIIGISGIDDDGTLLDFDDDEVRAANTIIRNSRLTYLLADHSKFARRPMVVMASIKDISALFTDRMPPESVRAIMAEHDIALHIAAPPDAPVEDTIA